ncbi:hypothetical protein [Lignipirellula cremea]|uniref:Uncharacterized protein n=1 Tax=Lignipirellula cremea TaxID=2528010 RepID=A0A518DPR2_9BACT|nr:hypothetical protein [Lignipirellula cremea]QDU93819.1 hypothetical protein Pla8534_16020 [Lignipirellula cremea]
MHPHMNDSTNQQLQQDRMTAIIGLVVIAILIAVMFWLGSLPGVAPQAPSGWPIMP